MRILNKYYRIASQGGFTLIEMLVSILILSVIMTAIFAFLWGASRYWQTGRDAADVTENARLGLNRMTRELKQGSLITVADTTQVSFAVDYGDGDETVTFGFTPGDGGAGGLVWRTSSSATQQATLIDNVDNAEFVYYGNDYRCDVNGDGRVSLEELNSCSTDPEAKISRVDIVLTMSSGGSAQQTFVGQAWLRNRDVSVNP
jgi:prepilin-type N-terminal cleavage/methylation domain-containing protein